MAIACSTNSLARAAGEGELIHLQVTIAGTFAEAADAHKNADSPSTQARGKAFCVMDPSFSVFFPCLAGRWPITFVFRGSSYLLGKEEMRFPDRFWSYSLRAAQRSVGWVQSHASPRRLPERIARTLCDKGYPTAAAAFDTPVKLAGADAAGHRFGWSVSISGDTNDRNLVALLLPVHHPFVKRTRRRAVVIDRAVLRSMF